MTTIKALFMLIIFFLAMSCSKDEDGQLDGDWLIPKDEIQDGGPGKDGIPSVDHPNFVNVSQISFLNDDDLIVGVERNGIVHGYPHAILNWHEIINDQISDINIAVVYCPLTGSATVWDRTINGTVTTFGVSGLLYNSNVIPYDRLSQSNWSQMRQESVNGSLIGLKAFSYRVVETTWKSWKKMYPNSLIVSNNTGFNRDYTSYPYGDYITNNSNFLFSVNPIDSRLPSKERVLGVFGNNMTYSIELFNDSVKTILDGGTIVCGSKNDNFIVAYKNNFNLSFEPIQDSLPIIMKDNEGNRWNVFGEAVSGSRQGKRLEKTESFISYWFAMGAFYPGISIYAN